MRTCSSETLKSSVKQEVAMELEEELVARETQGNSAIFEENLDKKKNNYTFNFYQLAFIPIKKIDFNDLFDLSFWSFAGFTLILLNSSLIVLYSFKNRFRKVFKWSYLTLFLLIISTFLLIVQGLIEEFSQIQIGYYLIVLNTLAVIYFSKKNQVEKVRSC
jgi:O-antigen ligase